MKKLNAKFFFRIFALVITLHLVFAIYPKQISAQQNDGNFPEFFNQLIPYGQWIENPNYGFVWIPEVESDFTPYLTNGYWQLTTYGWMWVSDYEWGWATFHYGRWDYNGSYGWFWVPDNEWGPSWVTWRRSKGYYGWAPMRPGVSISITFGSYNDVPSDRWIFVRDRDIESHDIGRNHIDRKNNFKIIKNSTVVNKTFYDEKRQTTYVAGPGREDVQKITGRTLNPLAVHENDKPGQNISNDQIQIYRPLIRKNKNNPAQGELTKLEDVKNVPKRDSEKQTSIKPDNKNNVYQTPNLNQPRKENRINQSPKSQNINIPTKNENTGQSPNSQIVNPQKKVNRIDQQPKPQTVNDPRNKNTDDQKRKEQNVNLPRSNNVDRPSRNNTDNDKKKIEEDYNND